MVIAEGSDTCWSLSYFQLANLLSHKLSGTWSGLPAAQQAFLKQGAEVTTAIDYDQHSDDTCRSFIIEQGPVAQALVFVEIDADRPDIARLERALRPNILPCIPRAPIMYGGASIPA